MLASPGLNPAALTLTFLLFPPSLAFGRLAAALAAVLLLPVALEHLFGASLVLPTARSPVVEDDGPRSPQEFVTRFARSLPCRSRPVGRRWPWCLWPRSPS
jgi:uncharacterized membrane protein YraQ (UPF0718 family)